MVELISLSVKYGVKAMAVQKLISFIFASANSMLGRGIPWWNKM